LSRRLTLEEVRNRFEERGYQLLSNEYNGARSRVSFRCPAGHIGEMPARTFFSGYGCIECSTENRRADFETIKSEFLKKGLTVLDENYINAHTRLTVLCSRGHESKVSWNEFTNGRTCKLCSRTLKPTIEHVREQFKKRGYTLLSTEYVNSSTKLDFICDKQHVYQIDWEHFSRGHGCGICRIENLKSGIGHPRWDPNKTHEERVKGRKFPALTVWRKQVFQRDNFTCKSCGTVGGKLNAHHLDSWNKFPDRRFDVDNGVTLCSRCHRQFHSEFGQGDNTKEQFDMWLSSRAEDTHINIASTSTSHSA
jgi:hypothetical protein